MLRFILKIVRPSSKKTEPFGRRALAMLVTTHLVASAFISRILKPRWLSLVVIMLFHFLLDSIPHYDFTKKDKVKTGLIIESFSDIILGLLLVFFFFQKNQPFDSFLWLAIFSGIFVDILFLPKLILDKSLIPYLDYHHSRTFHRKSKTILRGIIPQIIIIFLAIALRNLRL